MFNNARIQLDVRAALQEDSRIKRPELISVTVDEIGTVDLRGAVGSMRQRIAAIHDARRVEGVFEVVADDLKVHPPVAGRGSDDQLRATAIQQVTTDARIRSTHIHVKVRHGVATLSGYVYDESESAAAVDDVVSLDGVLGVVNEIAVR